MSRWPARVIRRVGTRLLLRLSWGHDCPNCHGKGFAGNHAGSEVHGVYPLDATLPALLELPLDAWPIRCDHCTATAPHPDAARKSMIEKHLWDSPSGDIEVGSMFLSTLEDEVHAPGEACGYGWTNCDGRHWVVRMPDGGGWEMMSRASNCTRREDTTHRCWVVHVDADGVPYHVDKDGPTCAAGAGSIQSHAWHGFFHNRALVLSPEPRR